MEGTAQNPALFFNDNSHSPASRCDLHGDVIDNFLRKYPSGNQFCPDISIGFTHRRAFDHQSLFVDYPSLSGDDHYASSRHLSPADLFVPAKVVWILT